MTAVVPGSNGRIADLLGSIRRKGIDLWCENGQLRYRAPKGALTQEEVTALREVKSHIVALLDGDDRRCKWAPLTFSQRARWNSYQLGERQPLRQIASATHLRGRLNVAALSASLAKVVQRHDALRTRIEVRDGAPIQEIAESCTCSPKLHDFTPLAESERQIRVHQLTEEIILTPVDLSVLPLFDVHLAKLRDDEHVLIVAMEHLISDMFSLGLLLRELFAVYVDLMSGRECSLPEIRMQFPSYARSQVSRQGTRVRGAHWDEHLARSERLKFPQDRWSSLPGPHLGGATAIRIEKDTKMALREWCRRRRTTLPLAVFSAYVALVLRWCNSSESVVLYQSDGRVSPDLESTIGFFASALYVPVALLETDTFGELITRVTQEYCRAYEHADFSEIASRTPAPELTRNTAFNWIPRGSQIDLAGLDGTNDALTASSAPLPHVMLKTLALDHEPVIMLYDEEEAVAGYVYFPLARFSESSMERFTRGLLAFIEVLLKEPERRLKGIPIV